MTLEYPAATPISQPSVDKNLISFSKCLYGKHLQMLTYAMRLELSASIFTLMLSGLDVVMVESHLGLRLLTDLHIL